MTEITKKDAERFSVKTVVTNLEAMMTEVTKKDCNPSTVNAACNAADKITNLLKLQLEYEKMLRLEARRGLSELD
jgi:hypothetical protein